MTHETMLRATIWTLAAVGCAFGTIAATSKLSPVRAVIEYHGESIRLAHPYYDYEESKNDPSNIHPDETARVPRLDAVASGLAHLFG